ncbi:MAG: pirin family protein [Bacteroidia bacterium]|nr:pirin family protein [Bacteroidia bacterium]
MSTQSLQYKLFPANERGYADYGWLKTYYSFSFANWYHPQKVHFGMLRVLNDDAIAPHAGFDMHPHNDMEIITIMFQGELTHQDSMGNTGVLKASEVQVMSAGTGIFHSEKNNSNEWTTLFQIWIFPDKKGHTPRYDQKKFNFSENQFQLLVSPDGRENSLWIHQNAFISRGNFNTNPTHYSLFDKKNGVYLMVISGQIKINNMTLNARDAIGIWNTEKIEIQILNNHTDILIIEIPMN